MLRWFRGTSGPGPLSRPTGAFTVGFTDFEWIPKVTNHVKNPPAYILARIYYPSLPVTHSDNDWQQKEWQGRSYWIPSPAYYPGYGYYLKMPWYVAYPLSRLVAGNVPIWAVENAPLVPEDRLKKFPIVIFSHGLAGIRTTYSTICTDLASQGYIVAAIEHRDGSASMSLMPENEIVLQYRHPPPEDQEAFEFRSEQLKHRRQEVSATIDLLTQSYEQDNIPNNLWKQSNGKEYSDRNDLVNNPITELIGRVDLNEKIRVMGHSFGAATCLITAQEDDRIGKIVALDPWMFPISPTFLTEKYTRSVPTLVINSSTFHWESNLDSIQTLLEKNKLISSSSDRSPCSVLITIDNTRHMDQSDFGLVIPEWLATRLRSQSLADPRETLALNTKLIKAFYRGPPSVDNADLDSISHISNILWGKDTVSSSTMEPRIRVDLKL